MEYVSVWGSLRSGWPYKIWTCCVLSWGGKSSFAFMLHDIVCLNVKLSSRTNLQCLGKRLVHPVEVGLGVGRPGIPVYAPVHCQEETVGFSTETQWGPLRGLFGPRFLQPRGHPNVSSDTHPVSQLRTMSAILGPVWNSSRILVEGKAAGAGDRHGLIPGVNLSKPFNVSGLQGLPLF